MTTTDTAALLLAVLKEPAEDTTRLVYADALEEAGQAERAEFIRVQCRVHTWAVGTSTAKDVADAVATWGRYHDLMEDAHQFLPPSVRNCGRGFRVRSDMLGHTEDESIPMRVHFVRGFIHSVTCSSEAWLRHCDAIYWHPSQTVKCDDCGGGRGIGHFSGIDYGPCFGCGGVGRIPRPFVPTAHPIREVRLTTEPHGDFGAINDIGYGGRVVIVARNVRYHRWPGITFHLPPAPPEPESPTVPLSGWRCRLRREQFETLRYDDSPAHIRDVRRLELECRVDGTLSARGLIGQRFGPVTAVDENGNLWSCEAILTDARMDVGGRLVHTDLTATSTTNPIRLG